MSSSWPLLRWPRHQPRRPKTCPDHPHYAIFGTNVCPLCAAKHAYARDKRLCEITAGYVDMVIGPTGKREAWCPECARKWDTLNNQLTADVNREMASWNEESPLSERQGTKGNV